MAAHDVAATSTATATTAPTHLPRVALALSSGGFGGAGGMTGFCAALDLFFGATPITAIGQYSGVSAGSIISTNIAAGISPLDIIKAVFSNQSHNGFRPWRRDEFFRANVSELRPTAARLARAALRRVGLGAESRSELGVLPSGLLSSDGLVENMRENLGRKHIARFSDLKRRLSIIFYDVLSNQRVVAGNGPGEHDLDIGDAMAASAAIPGAFMPRRLEIDGRVVLGVDGGTGGYRIGVRDFDEVDLLIAYNHASFAPVEDHVTHVSGPAVVGLAMQLSVNQSNIDEIANWMDAHPAAHAWVFQPPPRNIKSTFSLMRMLAETEECFELGKQFLRRNFAYYSTVLANHGVTTDPTFDSVTFADVRAHGAAIKSRR